MFHQISPDVGSKKIRRRVARGAGSGRGTTAGRGQKGQQSRTGKRDAPGFEGGQTPLIRRQPKWGGFNNPNSRKFEVLNIDTLEEKLAPGTYDIAALKAAKIIEGNGEVKLLGRGAVTKKFALSLHASSKTAKAALEKAGGTLTIIKIK
jgi:large subunit ribosomal protein L15